MVIFSPVRIKEGLWPGLIDDGLGRQWVEVFGMMSCTWLASDEIRPWGASRRGRFASCRGSSWLEADRWVGAMAFAGVEDLGKPGLPPGARSWRFGSMVRRSWRDVVARASHKPAGLEGKSRCISIIKRTPSEAGNSNS